MRFLLICEGASDDALAFHIEALMRQQGITEIEQLTSNTGRLLREKVGLGLGQFGDIDLLFVHRDADRAGVEARYGEIGEAVRQTGYNGLWVGMVPVRMTEAWLILDEAAIRRAVRRPHGRAPLNLPAPAEVERMANPKAALETALLEASEKSGRRRRNAQRGFPGFRRQLLQNLPVGGPLEQVASWARFRDDTIAALRGLGARS